MLMILLPTGGIVAGFLLLRRVPVLALTSAGPALPKVAVIIPARNEEGNLPALLRSLTQDQERPDEVLVVDDQSTDATADVAQQFGARVVASGPLPHGWTGKTWACHQGAIAATADVLCFLDADTSFVPGGYGRMARHFAAIPVGAALSVLPFHRTVCWYEELSLFFNIVLAMSAGGFGGLDAPHLFGQNLMLHRDLYFAAGGHEVVRSEVLENLHLAPEIEKAGGRLVTLGGKGTLGMRMFPEGFGQLCGSWRKAFATGARLISPLALGLSVYWLSSVAVIAAASPFTVQRWQLSAALYCVSVLQVGWYGRQLGTFSWVTVALYPVGLVFYFAIFGQSAWRRTRGHAGVWRGRRV